MIFAQFGKETNTVKCTDNAINSPTLALRAESPSIFQEKSGRGRRLCSQPAHSLIRRSSKKMDESVQFRTGHTGLPLVRMPNRKNCWLFRAHGILFTVDRQTWRLLRFHTKSLKTPWTVLLQKLKSDRFQASRNHNQGLCVKFQGFWKRGRPRLSCIWIWSMLNRNCAGREQSLLPLPDFSRKIEGDSARRVSNTGDTIVYYVHADNVQLYKAACGKEDWQNSFHKCYRKITCRWTRSHKDRSCCDPHTTWTKMGTRGSTQSSEGVGPYSRARHNCGCTLHHLGQLPRSCP